MQLSSSSDCSANRNCIFSSLARGLEYRVQDLGGHCLGVEVVESSSKHPSSELAIDQHLIHKPK